MAMARKGSRVITVADQRFRWRLVPRDVSQALLVIEAADNPGGQFVLYGPHMMEPGVRPPAEAVLTPARVAEIIQFALEQGWVPAQDGTFKASCNGGFNWDIMLPEDVLSQTPTPQELRRAGMKPTHSPTPTSNT